MSLKIGKFVYDALSKGTLALGDIAPVAYLKDTVPYTIYMPMGTQVDATKDDMEGSESCVVEILCADKTYPKLIDHLVEVRELMRKAIEDAISDDYGFQIDDYSVSVGRTSLDDQLGIYFQSMTYTFNTQETETNG